MPLSGMSIILLLPVIMTAGPGNRWDSPFSLNREPPNIITPYKHFGLGIFAAMNPGGVDQLRRNSNPKTPGLYYLYPRGAYSIDLNNAEKFEIWNLMATTFDSSYYDEYVLRNLKGYYYEMHRGEIKRREYHVRYSKGDTIYVISGWLGKFICFYRAIPGSTKADIRNFGKTIKEICPYCVEKRNYDHTAIEDKEDLYWVQLDYDKQVRIRYFRVTEDLKPDPDNPESLKGMTYNVIEITRFLDYELH